MKDLLTKRLIVVTGKGGVGKTTVAAALACVAADSGARKVALVESDDRESQHRLFDAPPSDGELVKHSLIPFINVRAEQVVEQFVRQKIRVSAIARRVIRHPVFAPFVAGAPGLKELAVLMEIRRLLGGDGTTNDPFDTVVFDAPATGHGLALLRAPSLAADAIRSGPFSELAAELRSLVNDAAHTAVVLTTVAEELPVQELIELRSDLQSIAPLDCATIVNQIYPPAPLELGAVAPDSIELWQRRRAVNEHELEVVRRDVDADAIELPLLPIDQGPALRRAMAARLAEQVA